MKIITASSILVLIGIFLLGCGPGTRLNCGNYAGEAYHYPEEETGIKAYAVLRNLENYIIADNTLYGNSVKVVPIGPEKLTNMKKSNYVGCQAKTYIGYVILVGDGEKVSRIQPGNIITFYRTGKPDKYGWKILREHISIENPMVIFIPETAFITRQSFKFYTGYFETVFAKFPDEAEIFESEIW